MPHRMITPEGHTRSELLSILEKSGKTLTENDCVAHATSRNPLVDLFFQIAAMRNASSEEMLSSFERAFVHDPQAALKILFWTRDIRGGQGERKVFRTILSHLARNRTDALRPNVTLLPVYGRWDDLLALFNTPLEGDALAFIDNALTGKLTDADASLCAKWMPREKSSKSVIARTIRKHMSLAPSAYRKLLSRLTSVVESDMCAGNWDGIEYSHVPSVAMLNYKKAFARHSPERWEAYIEALSSGEAKVNASVLYPYQVIKPLMAHSYYSGQSDVDANTRTLIEHQWDSLPNYLLDNPYRILPVVDTSGSMYGESTSVAPIDVSVSLGLYIAERNNGPFKDHFITFSGTPSLQRLKGKDLFSKVNELRASDWGMNTNVEAVFTLILNQAKSNDIGEEDMPNMILILSDMQFDQCAQNYGSTTMESIEAKYAEAGYAIPKIVFWNLAARGSNFPVAFDKIGTAMISGFNPSILKHVLSSGTITPEDIMNEVLNAERYSAVTAG